MGFQSYNATQATKGLQGTGRQANATFQGLSGALQGPPQGLQGPPGPTQQAATGSSYSLSGGMQGTGRGPLTERTMGGATNYANLPDENGVIAGGQGRANVGQMGPQLTEAQMQDPENAAMAGFQFAQSQDQPIQASAPVNVGGGQNPTIGAAPAPVAAAPGRPGPTMANAVSRGALQAGAPAQAPKAPQYGRTM